MGLHGNLSGQLTGAEHLDALAQLLDRAELEQAARIESVPVQLFQTPYINDRVFFPEYIREPALRQAAVQGHLTAFKASHDAVAGDGSGAFRAAAGILPTTAAHTLPDALLLVLLPAGRFE